MSFHHHHWLAIALFLWTITRIKATLKGRWIFLACMLLRSHCEASWPQSAPSRPLALDWPCDTPVKGFHERSCFKKGVFQVFVLFPDVIPRPKLGWRGQTWSSLPWAWRQGEDALDLRLCGDADWHVCHYQGQVLPTITKTLTEFEVAKTCSML